MIECLLDTNVVSEMRKSRKKRDPCFNEWLQATSLQQCYISVMTVAELEHGIMLKQRKDPQQGSALQDWLEQMVLTGFSKRILPFDLRASRFFAQMQVPDPKPVADSIIAATAMSHGLCVATRNANDFLRLGAHVVNPWEPSAPIAVLRDV